MTPLAPIIRSRQPKHHTPRWSNFINAPYAQRLRNRGLSYRQIGMKLARDEGRKTSYTAASVDLAIKKWKAGLMEDYFNDY